MSNKSKLLIIWYNKCKLYYNCHRDSADHYDFYNKMLGFPAILINIFNSTSLFSNYHDISSIFLLIIAASGVISTILTASQNYFELAKLKDQHIQLMSNYSKILYSIEKIIVLVKNEIKNDIDHDVISTILTKIEDAQAIYIHFPEYIWTKYNNKFRSKLSELNINTSDSINIILSTLKTKKDLTFLDDSSHQQFSEVITYNNKEDKDVININEKDVKEDIGVSVKEDVVVSVKDTVTVVKNELLNIK